VNTPDENPSALGTFDLPLRLPGQYFDKETNLHHNYFRDFDPSLGRYGESDPIGLRGGLNTYLYVAGSPFKFSDARGLDNPAMGPYNPPPGWVNPNSPALNYKPIRRNQSATVQQTCICRPRDEADREFNKVAGTFAVAGAVTVATLAAIAVASAAPEVATVAAGDALIMAIAGEPLLTPFLTGLMMSGYGFVVGGSIGAGIVQLTQPPVCK
jgi:RHS repeat-associated protein